MRSGAAALAALALSSAWALGADMPGGVALPLPARPVPQRVEIFSGWYLRGDLGAAWGIIDGANSVVPFADPTGNKLGNGFTAGVGFGVKTQWLRTDITIDYLSALKYEGTVTTAGDTTAKIQATTALFNGYVDLGTWYRITPYIGAGVGAAYTDVTDYVSGGSPPFTGGVNKKQWGFAWAATAGAAYPISPNLMLDVAYRYLNIGDVKTGSDAFGAMTFKNVAAHEVRVGLRWSFDDVR
jgi:opacity protein-like surface antigen